ncbi:MAG: PilW family protein, partial [Vicinamibacteria bacterium]
MTRFLSSGLERGFSLLEALLALTITLVVMALVAQTMGQLSMIYDTQSDLAASSTAAGLALDDIAYELALAGQGLGEGPAGILPRHARRVGSAASANALTLRSNPDVLASFLRAELLLPDEDAAADRSE